MTMERSSSMSKLLGQLVKAFSFHETDKTDFDKHSPEPEVQEEGVEALEHFGSGNPVLRLLVFLDDWERRRCLFDSQYVTDEGLYRKNPDDKDAKFLKDVVAKFAFGEAPLANPDATKFTRITEKDWAFAVVFSVPTTTASTNPSPRKVPTASSSSGSDSGYSSFPSLAESSSRLSGSSSRLLPQSLPNTPSRHCSGFGGQRRVTLASVMVYRESKVTPLLEKGLPPLRGYVRSAYHPKSRAKFGQNLKAYYNALDKDLACFSGDAGKRNLKGWRIGGEVKVKGQLLSRIVNLFSLKIWTEFVVLLVKHWGGRVKVVLISGKVGKALKRKEEVNANDPSDLDLDLVTPIFKFVHLLGQCLEKGEVQGLERERERVVEEKKWEKEEEKDSGFFSSGNLSAQFPGSGEAISEVADKSGLGGGGAYHHHSQSQDKPEEEKKSGFYLGDEDDEEPTEEKLALSEPDREKLWRKGEKGMTGRINLKEVPLDLDLGQGSSPRSGSQEEEKFYLNGSGRFSPFHEKQAFPSQPEYDLCHTMSQGILEVNLDKLVLRGINLGGQSPEMTTNLDQRLRDLCQKTKELSKLISDEDRTLTYFLLNLVELVK